MTSSIPPSKPKDTPPSLDWETIRRTLNETVALLDEKGGAAGAHDAIMQQRTVQAAQPLVPRIAIEDQLPVLAFQLGAERYAVPVAAVSAVAETKHITPIPCVPAYYRGVANLGGKIISILDLSALFGIQQAEVEVTARHLVVVVEGAGLEIGLYVNQVESVVYLSAEMLKASGSDEELEVQAVTTDGLVVLDVEHLLRDPRIRIHEEV